MVFVFLVFPSGRPESKPAKHAPLGFFKPSADLDLLSLAYRKVGVSQAYVRTYAPTIVYLHMLRL